MYAVRLWSIRHAGFWEAFYRRFEWAYVAAGPLLRRIGYERLEAPVAATERTVKGFLFDCRMCGRCILSSTGMSCPMNCPKTLRNGPCGGVRPGGQRGRERERSVPLIDGYARIPVRQRQPVGCAHRGHAVELALDAQPGHRVLGGHQHLEVLFPEDHVSGVGSVNGGQDARHLALRVFRVL